MPYQLPFPTFDALTVNTNQNVTVAYNVFDGWPIQQVRVYPRILCTKSLGQFIC